MYIKIRKREKLKREIHDECLIKAICRKRTCRRTFNGESNMLQANLATVSSTAEATRRELIILYIYLTLFLI